MGCYLTSDPIGLAGGENTYGYVKNPIDSIDPFGLSTCSDARKLADNLGPKPLGVGQHDAHHIVMSNSTDPKMKDLRKLMDDLNIDINDKRNSIWLPNTKNDRIMDALTTAHKGNGVHGKAYKQYVYDKLINSKADKEFLSALKNIKTELSNGKIFPLANGKMPV